MQLSILIASISRRADRAAALVRKLESQIGQRAVEVLMLTDNCQRSIGAKRNALVQAARGDYCCFVDDDDDVSDAYVPAICGALERRPDAVGLGVLLRRPAGKVLLWLGANFRRHPCMHSLPINHLCPIRTDIVRQVPFVNCNFGEDHDFAERVAPLVPYVKHTRRVLYFANYDPATSASRGLGQYSDAQAVWQAVFSAYADEQPEFEPSRRWALHNLEDTRPARILDVGCGRGDVVHRLRYGMSGHVEGLDVLDLGVDLGVRPLHLADLATRDGTNTLRQTGRWDCCTCLHVLEHLPEWEIASVHYSLAQIARRALVTVSLRPWEFAGRELRRTLWPAERWHDAFLERWHILRFEHDGAAARFELASRDAQ